MRTNWVTLLIIAYACPLIGQNLPPGFIAEKLFTGLNPTTFTFGPENRIFLLDKSGKVLTINQAGQLLPNPLVQVDVDDFNERGLSGITFHPRFADFPYVYLYYTPKAQNQNRVSRFRINGDQVIPNSEEIILELPKLTGFIHNGGRLKFDREEHLFISVGDGADKWSAQSPHSLLGKILRLDAEGQIPESNPFYETYDQVHRAIWSSGLRNPFSLDIHERTGQVFVGDVGDGRWEEINEILAGKNYGWPHQEGPRQPQEDGFGAYTEPYFAYDHDRGCAIVGVAIMDQPTAYPTEYEDAVFYADYCKGTIHYLDGHPSHDHLFATEFERPVDIQVSPEGELYVLTRKGLGGGSVEDNTSTQQGELWRIRYIGDGPPQISIHPEVSRLVVGDQVDLRVKAFGTPPINYSWYRNDTFLIQEEAGLFNLEVKALHDSLDWYYAVATNTYGTDTSRNVSLNIINGHRPEPVITKPEVTAYQSLDTIQFDGYASDREDGLLPDQALTWQIDFHHREHTHPVLDPTKGKPAGPIIVPALTETDTLVWYRIRLKATDQTQLSQTTFVDIFPKLSRFKVTGPPGCSINIDGVQTRLPATMSTVKGVVRNLAAPTSYYDDDKIYVFKQWSSSQQNPLLVTQVWHDTTLTVDYRSLPLGNGTGLLARYSNGTDLLNSESFSRIDSTIDFSWLDRSPWPGVIQEDRFGVIWSGYLEPLFDGEYSFSVFTDDGVRLWIADTLLIDAWFPRPATENQGTIQLKNGKRYPIIMAYFEDLGFAVSQLSWDPPYIKKQIIPARQFYPARIELPGKVKVLCWYDKNQNGVREADESFVPEGEISIRYAQDSVVHRGKLKNQPYFSGWINPGEYRLDFNLGNQIYKATTPIPETLDIQSLDTHTVEIPLITNPDAEQINEYLNFTLYPNPVLNEVVVEFHSIGSQKIELDVINQLGQILIHQDLVAQGGLERIHLRTTELNSGKYQLVMKSSYGQTSISFIKINP